MPSRIFRDCIICQGSKKRQHNGTVAKLAQLVSARARGRAFFISRSVGGPRLPSSKGVGGREKTKTKTEGGRGSEPQIRPRRGKDLR